jgi:HK97 family phage prohead protease
VNTKSLHVDIKDADKGEISGVFSTFDVVDKDGDVTLKGAFTDGETVRISAYGHTSWSGALPVGKATIRETSDGGVFEGQFFMNTTAGRDTFQVVKELGDQQEWSYGYDIVKESFGEFDGQRVTFLEQLKVHEVSPVMVGAGENTRTLSMKSQKTGREAPVEYKRAIRPHTAAATAREWDGPAVVAAISDDASVSDLRTVYAWSDGDPEVKASYKFPHHHGVDGPANIRALIAGIAALNGARGGAAIPEDDRKAVYDHLAAHLRDADRDPPELRDLGSGQMKLHEEAFEALGGISDYLDSARRVAALRAQHGKSLSQVNLEALDWVGEDLERLLTEHKALMRRIRNAPNDAAAEEFVRLLAMQRRAT